MISIFTNSFRQQFKLVQNPVSILIRNYHKQPIPVTWEKPEKGWTKLNFDGSYKGNEGKGSIGGIFRNHKAEFLLGYSESIGGQSTSSIAELAALVRGLELVLEYGYGSNIWLEGDAKTLLDIIVKRRNVKCEQMRKYINDIHLIIPELDNVIVSHVYREGNRAADKFAQLGHCVDEPTIWRCVPPEDVVPIVRDDAQGKIVLRKR
ncbi:Polynucleotidyl transferase ribonuclease H-like superfamily protein [Euphorbia peplus]|nr:Polynucleotidyl transferase ribonuclease H-like superfamily protein [Euphorbia peplus]